MLEIHPLNAYKMQLYHAVIIYMLYCYNVVYNVTASSFKTAKLKMGTQSSWPVTENSIWTFCEHWQQKRCLGTVRDRVSGNQMQESTREYCTTAYFPSTSTAVPWFLGIVEIPTPKELLYELQKPYSPVP